MNRSRSRTLPLSNFPLWERLGKKRALTSFEIDLTARCNNDCRHCYINLDAGDRQAQAREMSADRIVELAGQAASLGALWCMLSGGEPLLRRDFAEIYLRLKKKGLLVAIFTNATLITDEHVRLFKTYPPRDIEVSVYGVTRETYERVTRKAGSFDAFCQGLDRLLDSGLKVRLKAMALRSNVKEIPDITRFCQARTKDYFRFDPLLHLRNDGNEERNREIRAERLSPTEIVELERADPERFKSLQESCDQLIVPEFAQRQGRHLFHCGAGKDSFSLSYDGKLRLCSTLNHPASVYDLSRGTLHEAWNRFIPAILGMTSDDPDYLKTCHVCPIKNLCQYCPAVAHLETGRLDRRGEDFCRTAELRAESIKKT